MNVARPVTELASAIPRSPIGPTSARLSPRLSRTIVALTFTGVRASFLA